jgi:hypothetical protein
MSSVPPDAVPPSGKLDPYPLHGATRQGKTMTMLVSKDLTRVERFEIMWRAKCPGSASISEGTVVTQTPIQAKPGSLTFGGVAVYGVKTGLFRSQLAPRGGRAQVQAWLSGSLLRGGRMRGSWRVALAAFDAGGKQLKACDTGPIRWRGGALTDEGYACIHPPDRPPVWVRCTR